MLKNNKSQIIDLILKTGAIPDEWKIAITLPIKDYNKIGRTEPQNPRFMCLL